MVIPRPFSRRALLGAIVPLSFAALSACSSAPSAADRASQTDEAARLARQRGYVHERRYAATEVRDTWLVGQTPIDVSLMAPSEGGSYPLVVYLPGLGEPANAAPAWRRSWAEAGYVVVGLQPADLGASLWGSPAARAGDFRGIASRQFGRAALAERSVLLRAAYQELLRRKQSGSVPLLQHADVTRVAVAGFDLGAQSALVAAGATSDGAVNDIVPPGQLRAVIALSPFADPARAGFEREFGSVRTPVLSVTGLNDLDPYGFVTSSAARRVPFEYMPPDGKALVVVFGATHTLLSGRAQPAGERVVLAGANRRPDDVESGADAPAGRGRQNSANAPLRLPRDDGTFALDIAPGTWGTQLGQIEAITGAYLDARVKGDTLAAEWLARDLARWLGEAGEVRTK